MASKKLEDLIGEIDENHLEESAAKLLAVMQKNDLSLKEAAGITEPMQEEIYVLAEQAYTQEKHVEALTLFQILTNLNPESFKYMYGLASAYHQIKDYINASQAFFVALSLDPQNPMPCFYMADCMLNLEFYEDTENFLNMTIELCKADEKYNEIAERALLIKKSLKSKKHD